MIYLIFILLVLVVSYNLFKRAAGTLSVYRLNMISWIFYFFLVLQCLIGAVEIIAHVDNHYMIDYIQHESSRLYGFTAICWTLIGLPQGMLFACKVFRIKSMREIFNTYCYRPIIEQGYGVSPRWVFQMCLLISIVSMCSVVYVFFVIHEIPFAKFFSAESAMDLALYRQSANRFFPGNEYVKNILALYICPIFSYVAYCYYLCDKRKINFIWWLCSFVSSLAIVTFDLSKAPVIVYCLGYLFLYVLRGGVLAEKHCFGLF